MKKTLILKKLKFGGITVIKTMIYAEYHGWQEEKMYFDKMGKFMPNYDRQIKIKKQIKELQEELKKLQQN